MSRGKAGVKKRKGMTREQRNTQNAQNREKRRHERALADAEKFRNEPITVNLRVSHRINSVMYGPGHVTLPRVLANQLVEDDKRAVAHEEDLFQSYGVIVGPPRTRQGIATTRKVPVEVFNSPVESIEPVNSKG